MPSKLVHQVNSLIALGQPYGHVHARKDAFSQRAPGLRHRKVKHRKYWTFNRTWDFANPFSFNERQQIERVCRWKGPTVAEEYMTSLAHDVDDKTWDFDGVSRSERSAIRTYWESFCAWLVLNPDILRERIGVDVVEGRVLRLIDGIQVWENEPALIAAYDALYKHVQFLIQRKPALRAALAEYGEPHYSEQLQERDA